MSAVTLLSCSCRSTGSKATTGTIVENTGDNSTAKQSVKQYTYEIKNVFPHSTDSYTQGLYWHDGYLWESTGQYGESALKQVDLNSGKILKEIPLDQKYFGEGAALLNGKIYQLTWMEGVCFVYDAATLKKTEEFKYAGEGWGLTTDGKKLYLSNGTNEIQIIDPETFRQEQVVRVTRNKKRVNYLNELEWINGKIWANIYDSHTVVIIDPATGDVEGEVDFTGILPQPDRTRWTDVFNGIAYDDENDRIFVTGKYWNKLFEVGIKEK